jgi:hypothetical protein
MTDIANKQTNADDHCIGRVYYGPFEWTFTHEDLSRVDLSNRRLALSPEQWLEQNPDISEEELKRLEDLEFPFSE